MVLDTQSLHAAVGVPAATTGRDAAKKVPGRKRGLAVDVLGLVIAVVVLAASAHDNAVGIALLDKVAADTGTVEKALVDQGFKTAVVDHGTVAAGPRDGGEPAPALDRLRRTGAEGGPKYRARVKPASR